MRRTLVRLRRAVPRAAELEVLWALSVAGPLLDVLGRYPEFFTFHGSSTANVVGFGLVVTLVPPLLLWGVELGLSALSTRMGTALHLFLVAVLVALFALRVLAPHPAVPAEAALALAAAAGVLGSVAYTRYRTPRIFLAVLTPFPLVVVLLFLFSSPTSALIRADAPAVAGASRASATPVVVIAFDELSTVSLMNRAGRIDAARYPNVAALAGDATWYRNATTVAAHTESAVPAILTGLVPRLGTPPEYADYPRNLFALLAPTHGIVAMEALTHLCPDKLCGTQRTGALSRSTLSWAQSVASDAVVVYLDGTLPARLTADLPDISTTWGDFGQGEHADRTPPPAPGTVCGRRVCDAAASIEPSARPRVYFFDVELPHAPWYYLPDGKQYAGDAGERVPGVDSHGRWTTDPWPVLVGYQRHLLQLGYADFGLGLVLDALREAGLYDKALIVVTADHGAAYESGEPRRLVTSANLEQIAFVPLLVKLPDQTTARVDDRSARTIDILPTIADALHIRIPWHVDGRSLLRPATPRATAVTLTANSGKKVTAPLADLVRVRAADLRRQVSLFGDGPWKRVFRLGGEQSFFDRRVRDLHVGGAAGTVAFAGGHVLHDVDPTSGLLPVYVHGSVKGLRPGAELAITVDGTIAAITRTYRAGGGQVFTAVLDPTMLRAGEDHLAAFAITKAGRSAVFHALRAPG